MVYFAESKNSLELFIKKFTRETIVTRFAPQGIILGWNGLLNIPAFLAFKYCPYDPQSGLSTYV